MLMDEQPGKLAYIHGKNGI